MNHDTRKIIEEVRRLANQFGIVGEGVSGSLARGYNIYVQSVTPGGCEPAPPEEEEAPE